VVFSLQLSCPAYDGAPGSGKKLSSVSADTPCRAQLGAGQLPPGLEAALCSMSKGEKALFVIPAADMQPSNSSSSAKQQQSGLSVAQLPAKCAQLEAAIDLIDLVQVWSQMGCIDTVLCGCFGCDAYSCIVLAWSTSCSGVFRAVLPAAAYVKAVSQSFHGLLVEQCVSTIRLSLLCLHACVRMTCARRCVT
jgi:hypothetical protein